MSNRLLSDRLRFENHEQFNILVRMHLSFQLDLNTEEFENEPDDRGIFRKLNRLHRKAKGCAAKASSPVDQRKQHLTPQLMQQMQKLMSFLDEEQNIVQEGIFRRTGALSRQAELKNALCQGQEVDFSSATFTVHDCASVFKAFLAELPEPLLTDAYHSAHCQLAQLMVSGADGLDTRLTNSLQLLLLLLPDENRQLLERLLALLHRTALADGNKMTAMSLATLFTPHLICPRRLTPETLHAMSQQMAPVVAFMITQGDILFDIPEKLATDIQAYFIEQSRKRSVTPGQQLDESVTDSTAATVYSFVDREKTAQAHNSNYTTDTALAQLYAHIQSLPESSRKRKLIKQFNKENGQGTPLINREKSAKMSLGDSIKRHIFHRSLLSRTPKRSRTPLTNITETPPHPYGLEKRPKTRILFQTVQLPSASPDTPVAPSKPEGETKNIVREEEAPRRLSKKYPSEPNLRISGEEGRRRSSMGAASLPDVSSERCMRLSGKVVEVMSLNHSDESSDRSLISPITKSTRRMPKYMQESIMTPRSRKPVMLLGATLGGSVSEERSQQLDDCDFREEDEDEYASSGEKMGDKEEPVESLSSPFRDYLFTRSVLTASPTDLSFSSQPDDFRSTTDIRDFNESEMSESLLFCLNGNQPDGVDLEALEEDLNLDGVVAKKRCLRSPAGLDETSL